MELRSRQDRQKTAAMAAVGANFFTMPFLRKIRSRKIAGRRIALLPFILYATAVKIPQRRR